MTLGKLLSSFSTDDGAFKTERSKGLSGGNGRALANQAWLFQNEEEQTDKTNSSHVSVFQRESTDSFDRTERSTLREIHTTKLSRVYLQLKWFTLCSHFLWKVQDVRLIDVNQAPPPRGSYTADH